MRKVFRIITILLATLGLLIMGNVAYGQTGKKIIVGFSQVGAENEWRVAMSRLLKEAFAKEKDIDFLFSDAQGKQENQLKALRTFILQKVDFIVYAPVVQTGWDSILQEAKEANIPVIIINRLIKTSTVKKEDYTVTFIGPDNVNAGRVAAKFFVDKFKDAPGTINIAQLEGTVGASSSVERKTGFDEVINGQS